MGTGRAVDHVEPNATAVNGDAAPQAGAPTPSELRDLEFRRARIVTALGVTGKLVAPMFGIGGLLMLSGLAIWLADRKEPLVAGIVGGFGVCWTLFWWLFVSFRNASLQADLDALDARRSVVERFTAAGGEGSGEPSYFDRLVRINVENLAAYYALVKVHTNKSFLVTLTVGVVGFVLLAAGLVLGYGSGDRSERLSYIASGAGILTEFIAGVFFYLYNRTVRQLKDYHDSLLSVQNVLLAFKLVGDLSDTGQKTTMVGQMLAYLMRDKPMLLQPGASQEAVR